MGNRVISISDSAWKADDNLELYRDISMVSERKDKKFIIPRPEHSELNGTIYENDGIDGYFSKATL